MSQTTVFPPTPPLSTTAATIPTPTTTLPAFTPITTVATNPTPTTTLPDFTPISTAATRPTPTTTAPAFTPISTAATRPTPTSTVPAFTPTFGPPTSGPSTFPGILVTSTVAKGIFGVGANLDPLIIFALVVAGLVFLLMIGALIYCCCYYCGINPPRPQHTIIRRTSSLQSIRQENPYRSSIYHTPDPEVIVYRRPSIQEEHSCIVHSMPRQKYMYPDDVIGFGNDVSYNTIRPRIMSGSAPFFTTLGSGYAMGHSMRSMPNRFGTRSVRLYDDDRSPRIVTLY